MKKILNAIGLSAVLTLGASGLASAAPFTLGSDGEFNTWAADNGFTKVFGGNVRWGNGGPSGDWEFSVVDGGDLPVDQKQLDWASGTNDHTTTFTFNAGTGGVSLNLGQFGASNGNFINSNPNTLFLRAAANSGQTAAMLNNVVIEFADLTSIILGSLLGDSNANWIGIVDPRFAQGFSVTTASAQLDGGTDGHGSRPMYQFKVGTSTIPVPEPGTLALLGAGLAGLGVIGRRRRAA